MDSADSSNTAELPDLPLETLFSYLDKREIISARLVCRQWNSIALSFFPKKVAISTRRFAEQRLPEGIDILKTFNPNIFTCISYNNVTQNLEWRHNNKHLLSKFLGCLKYIGANQNITYISVVGAVELESLVSIVNFQGLPNLVTLITHYFPNCGEYNFTSEFLPGSLSSLKTLKQISCPDIDTAEAAKLFMQSLVDASPNLEKLTTNFYYDLTRHKKVKRLKLCYPPKDAALLENMLGGVANTLASLTLQEFSFGTTLPRLPNLTALQIINTKAGSSPFLNISTSAPKIKVLKSLSPEGQDPSLSQYLLSKPENLQELHIICCRGLPTHEAHDWCKEVCSTLAFLPPNLKTLRVSGTCLLGSNLFQHNIFEFVLNIDFPNLIIECGDKDMGPCDWFSDFIKGVMRADVHSSGKGRQGSLEICLCKQESKVKQLDGEVLLDFPHAMRKLSTRWDRVILKHLTIPSSQMEILQRQVATNNLPVEFFYAFGQRK